MIPRWSLQDSIPYDATPGAPPRTGPSAKQVNRAVKVAIVLLAVAAVVYLMRYVLLLVNRTVLLNSWLAAAAVVLGIVASLAALAATITCWVVMTRWLIARRAAVFAHLGIDEPRSSSALWLGCLVPVVNLFWAPVYVIETATAEGFYNRLRKQIIVWWVLWILSAFAATFAVASLFTFRWFGIGVDRTAQGIADNTVAVICAYLLALATLLALARVYRGFERKPVERPSHRWVVVARDDEREAPAAGPESESALPVEPTGREPAA